MQLRRDRVVEMGRVHLASLAIVWTHPRVAQLDIVLNRNLRSTLARWIPPSGVLEVNAKVKSRDARALREIISHEAAHVVVWDRSGRAARPHGPEWSALMQAAGIRPRATLVRCGYRRNGTWRGARTRHVCPVCHFSRFAKRRVPRWRCPECRAIGLEGVLKTERVSSR